MILHNRKINVTMRRTAPFYDSSHAQICQDLMPCILILIVEMASKPFSDFYAGQRSFRLK